MARSISEEQASLWQRIFDSLLFKVSSVVGKVIAVEKWLLSQKGREFYNECLSMVIRGFGEEGRGTRFAKMWACGLLAARKVNLNSSSDIFVPFITLLIYRAFNQRHDIKCNNF